MKEINTDDIIFSLDIGTRNIIGIVGEYDLDENFNVLAYSIKKHRKRNMYDGQIHDIEGVTKVVREIVNDLEKELGIVLKKVSLAAAGRALKTHKIVLEREIDSRREITKSDIEALDLLAVQKAQEEINRDGLNKEFMYYSIGYSVVDYYLDEDKIENLDGHKGSRIGVELLATFLPQIVIEGLYSVIGRAGLEVASVTLEPIAAINVAIKEELRLLNLALVDIGAGTSDIALTKDGQIISYAMTQLAGDEITESLAKKYLLDFNQAEDLKISLCQKEKHKFIDVIGIEHHLTTDEIVKDNMEILTVIGREIAEEIIKYNGKEPSAVFLIGGSSNMPGLKGIIAENLGLPKERVSIRSISMLENVFGIEDYAGPDMITPIGIAIEGVQNKYRNFIKVKFNNEEVSIFNTDNLKVSDVLIVCNYDPKNLMPKWPRDFTYYLNNKKRRIIGDGVSNPKISINGQRANLKTKIVDGDIIVVEPAVEKELRTPYLKDILPKSVNVEDVLVNGFEVGEDYLMMENDQVLMPDYLSRNKEFKKTSNKDNKEKKETKDLKKTLILTVNGQSKTIHHNKEKFVFVDIFDYIDFDRSSLKGRLILEINGREAEYLETLSNGDDLKIYWD